MNEVTQTVVLIGYLACVFACLCRLRFCRSVSLPSSDVPERPSKSKNLTDARNHYRILDYVSMGDEEHKLNWTRPIVNCLSEMTA